MFNNYAFSNDNEEPFFLGQESWETFLQNESQNLSSRAPPAPGVSEMIFEKPEETYERMEEDYLPYDQQLDMLRTDTGFDFFNMKRQESTKPVEYQAERSDCGRDEETEEETGSVTTRDSVLERGQPFDSDGFSVGTNDAVFDDNLEIDNELTRAIVYVLSDRSDEEKAYIEKIFPMLLSSVKEVIATNQLPLNEQMISAIIKGILYGKEEMIAAEKEVLRDLTQQEMDDVTQDRPEQMVSEDDLVMSNRKEKRATKGNRNGSSMNHFNENYVSNIFQFARRNYPDDKEIQRIGNERNVSATNFKRLVGAKLTDGVLTRKAKARITESGKELVGNIEYWMRDGYFDQCTDREKYILHKEKALRDLALAGKY